MRIIHLINNLTTGGAERLVVELSKEMRDLGHDVRIVQLTHSPEKSPPASEAKSAGLDVEILGRHRFDPRNILRLRKLTQGADIINAHLFPALYLAALVDGPVRVLTEHSTVNRRQKSPFMHVLDRIVYRRFDCCVAISDGVKSSADGYLESLGISLGCVTVQNGVRLQDYSTTAPSVRNGPLKLITVGKLNATKNVTEAIAAVDGLTGVSLTVVGAGKLRSALESQVEENHQRQQVTFLGARTDIPALLGQHHAMIITSEYEGFGLVAVEAMAAHVPVLCPDIRGVGDVVLHGEAGLLHRPHDVYQLRANVERLRDDDNYRKQLAISAHTRSRVFGIESCAENYLILYASLLG